MTSKRNCWEFKFCRREPGGIKVDELGVCPAATDMRADGIHGGECGGRACWVLVGTLCGGEVQGTFASKLQGCLHCDFYRQVSRAEGGSLLSPGAILERLG